MNVPYRFQWGLTIVLLIIAAMLAAIQVADPMDLGISPVAKNWMSIISAGISAALAFLPKVTKPPADDRVGMD